jgi:hypothetical protein
MNWRCCHVHERVRLPEARGHMARCSYDRRRDLAYTYDYEATALRLRGRRASGGGAGSCNRRPRREHKRLVNDALRLKADHDRRLQAKELFGAFQACAGGRAGGGHRPGRAGAFRRPARLAGEEPASHRPCPRLNAGPQFGGFRHSRASSQGLPVVGRRRLCLLITRSGQLAGGDRTRSRSARPTCHSQGRR